MEQIWSHWQASQLGNMTVVPDQTTIKATFVFIMSPISLSLSFLELQELAHFSFRQRGSLDWFSPLACQPAK